MTEDFLVENGGYKIVLVVTETNTRNVPNLVNLNLVTTVLHR